MNTTRIARIRSFLLDRGMVYFYAIFIAGYFLLPMAAGHRRLYYILVFPAVLLLWRQLWAFYRGNLLAALMLAYCLYMVASLAWTADFGAPEAFSAVWYTVALGSFVFVSGFLWQQYSDRMDLFARRAIWLAAAAAIVSTVAWYIDNPFPDSRLVPLGVMHHPNKTSCAYGVFLLLCMYYLFNSPDRNSRLLYLCMACALGALIVFSQSRTALAGVSVGLLVLAGRRALGFLALAAASSWFLVSTIGEQWQVRVHSFSYRPGIWQQVVSDMEGHWLFGMGLLSDPTVFAYDQDFNHAHNAYLATLRDGGLLGLFLMLAMLAVAALWAARLYFKRGEVIYLALLLQGMVFITMDFDRLLVFPKELWLFFWLPVALIMGVYPGSDKAAPGRYHARPAR